MDKPQFRLLPLIHLLPGYSLVLHRCRVLALFSCSKHCHLSDILARLCPILLSPRCGNDWLCFLVLHYWGLVSSQKQEDTYYDWYQVIEKWRDHPSGEAYEHQSSQAIDDGHAAVPADEATQQRMQANDQSKVDSHQDDCGHPILHHNGQVHAPVDRAIDVVDSFLIPLER
jgi:hypothetical protein